MPSYRYWEQIGYRVVTEDGRLGIISGARVEGGKWKIDIVVGGSDVITINPDTLEYLGKGILRYVTEILMPQIAKDFNLDLPTKEAILSYLTGHHLI